MARRRKRPRILCVSPDGRCLMTASRWAAARNKAATIWDLHDQGARCVASLEGEGGSSPRSPLSTRLNCAWAPDESWVAAGAQEEGDVHIWKTSSCSSPFHWQRLHTAVGEGFELLAVSAHGCRIVTGAPDVFYPRRVFHCWIDSLPDTLGRNLVSARSPPPHTTPVRRSSIATIPTASAIDPPSASPPCLTTVTISLVYEVFASPDDEADEVQTWYPIGGGALNVVTTGRGLILGATVEV